ncbi:beta-1,4-galactosyltransferase 2 [Bufo bufo]|uniref:beta-1,4-galactosyltransferase 2 n=1 Tax=Bufo bufo TaxID=8384 RepID=UPI001ABE4290|nr:beta-1,4-galactosyltransferase 2 [Bufo bufo]XP_040263902.1 beta-1,4-galactosyltransferase 2 [Bufo bufo]
MTRLLLGVTLERICKAVLLLCLVHFVIIMILYFDVYAQRLDFFTRFNVRNYSRLHPYYNFTRPNGTVHSYAAAVTSTAESCTASVKVDPNQTVTERPLPPCPDSPPGLVGRLLIEFSSPMSMERVQRENPDVTEGGRYTPSDCQPKERVAIIIPFRHRDHHLKYWLHYIHPILRRQKVEYGIYIINQFGEETFNRAKLMNVGFLEALKDAEYDCFIFSDVDLIPMDDRNLYHCYEQPRHFAIAMDKFGFRLPYAGYFGGVSGLSKLQFQKINGFPNEYWGWGGEDDDIYNRITLNGMKVSRPDIRIGRYRMIKHERDKHNEPNPQRFTKIQNTKVTMRKDGINSLRYQVVHFAKYPMYTNITVDIGKPPPRPVRG